VGCDVRIGTSGYHYKHWKGPFYPERFAPSKMLQFYAERFDTVELNTTFYRLPPKTAVEEWREGSPPGFLFAAKGSRFITHMKKLRDPAGALDRYFDALKPLGGKLGPIVFQLPPFWQRDLGRLRDFLTALPTRHRYAFEFRNPTWHTPEVYALLENHNAAFCPFDIGGFHSPILTTADFAYVRLHGPGPGKYQGSYSRSALNRWARRVEEWRETLRAVYLYFDNDMSGFAVHDALALRGASFSLRRASARQNT
jgi:uncharacterized protein YecE (DUF72 family)